MPCNKPPGSPTNLTLLFVDQTSAIISWNPPVKETSNPAFPKNKYAHNIVYKAVCLSCSANVVFNPSTDTFNETKLTLTNLEPVSTYTIQIHSINGVSYLVDQDSYFVNDSITEYAAGETIKNKTQSTNSKSQNAFTNAGERIDLSLIKTEYAEIIFTTESAILSTVFNVRIISTTSTEINLVWDKPVQGDLPVEFYEVRWFPKTELDGFNKTALTTKETRAHIDGLMENTEYGFQVRCKTINGYGSYSNIVYAQTHLSVGSGKCL